MDKYTFFYWFLVYGKGTKIALFIDSSLRSEFPVVMSVTISAKKPMFGSSLPLVVCMRVHVLFTYYVVGTQNVN
jgi:hypothetical protein